MCPGVPDAWKEFHLAERDREKAKTRERDAALYQGAAKLYRAETEGKTGKPTTSQVLH